MVTDSAQHRTIAPSEVPATVLARAANQVRQFICGLHGHDALLHFEQDRMSLQCTSCGYQTPGWNLNDAPARSHSEDEAARLGIWSGWRSTASRRVA